jgi:hypothetical protein
MATDAVVAEVRQARETLAKRFNYDLRAMIEDAKARQAAGTRKTVSFPAKPAGRPPIPLPPVPVAELADRPPEPQS